jgi:hypothetical protein
MGNFTTDTDVYATLGRLLGDIVTSAGVGATLPSAVEVETSRVALVANDSLTARDALGRRRGRDLPPRPAACGNAFPGR